jgi:AcrR family transcriptional regulator
VASVTNTEGDAAMERGGTYQDTDESGRLESHRAAAGSGGPRPPGRPRSAVADAAILAAARELLAERGWDAMTLGDVAARAGVAKTTLYRRWPGKAELVVDAMAHLFDQLTPVDAGSVRADARAVIEQLVALLSRPEAQGAFLALAAQSARDPALRAAVREKIIDRQRRLVHEGAARAAARGDDVRIEDPELLFDVLAGTVVQRLLIEGEPVDAGYLGRFLDLIGLAVRDRGGRAV